MSQESIDIYDVYSLVRNVNDETVVSVSTRIISVNL